MCSGVAEMAEVAELELLLPGAPSRPFASSTAKRLAREARSSARPRLRPWRAPALSFDAAASLDVLLALAEAPAPTITPGDSVGFLVHAAELAVELVTRGRVLPGLVILEGGPPEARWLPAPTSGDVVAAGALAAAMPPLLRAQPTAGERAEPVNPPALVTEVLTVLVDTAARQAVAGSRLAPPRRGRKPKVLPPAEAFLAAVTADDPVVVGDPDELAKLAQALDEWRRSGLAPAGALRTCFRLTPPGDESSEADIESPGHRDDPGAQATWRLEFLLQSTSDPSLLVPAGEVWRSGPALASIDLGDENPRERLLGDLGHATRLLPELETALQAPHPEDLELDTQGAYRFLSEGAVLLEQAGFGILVPPWWRTDASRLALKLRVRSLAGDEGDGLPSLLGMEALCDGDGGRNSCSIDSGPTGPALSGNRRARRAGRCRPSRPPRSRSASIGSSTPVPYLPTWSSRHARRPCRKRSCANSTIRPSKCMAPALSNCSSPPTGRWWQPPRREHSAAGRSQTGSGPVRWWRPFGWIRRAQSCRRSRRTRPPRPALTQIDQPLRWRRAGCLHLLWVRRCARPYGLWAGVLQIWGASS